MKNFSFKFYAEGRTKEEEYKTAVFAELGINPDKVDIEVLGSKLESFANASELSKLPIFDDLSPDVRTTVLSVLSNPAESTLQDLISALGKQSDIVSTSDQPPSSSDVDKMEPTPPPMATPGLGANVASPI
jgi:hypothetical protein